MSVNVVHRSNGPVVTGLRVTREEQRLESSTSTHRMVHQCRQPSAHMTPLARQFERLTIGTKDKPQIPPPNAGRRSTGRPFESPPVSPGSSQVSTGKSVTLRSPIAPRTVSPANESRRSTGHPFESPPVSPGSSQISTGKSVSPIAFRPVSPPLRKTPSDDNLSVSSRSSLERLREMVGVRQSGSDDSSTSTRARSNSLAAMKKLVQMSQIMKQRPCVSPVQLMCVPFRPANLASSTSTAQSMSVLTAQPVGSSQAINAAPSSSEQVGSGLCVPSAESQTTGGDRECSCEELEFDLEIRVQPGCKEKGRGKAEIKCSSRGATPYDLYVNNRKVWHQQNN